MKRRDFLHASVAGLTLGGLFSPLSLLAPSAQGAEFPATGKKILLKVILDGGPDFRHLLPPPYQSDENSYGYQYWKNRATAHELGNDSASWQTRWQQDYYHIQHGNLEFGMLKKCTWLKQMWDAGKVAIFNNIEVSNNRAHDHSLLILEQGDTTIPAYAASRPGWGGKLAAAANTRIASFTPLPRNFTYGPHPSDPNNHLNDRVIAIPDSRNVGLLEAHHDAPTPTQRAAVISRALKNYYAAKQGEMDVNSPYARFVRHAAYLRQLGQAMESRLSTLSVPAEFTTLLAEGGMYDASFGRQLRNVYDALLCNDFLDFSIGSLEYLLFDTHKFQKADLEPKLEDMFGANKAFHALYQNLPGSVSDNLTWVITGEFGRQLRSNGDVGTDHGKGNSVLVIGAAVPGGVYGEMFPQEELQRINDRSPDITPKTSMQHLFALLADWVHPGSGNVVFPNRSSALLEANLFG